jgi:hypothetical protein
MEDEELERGEEKRGERTEFLLCSSLLKDPQ